MSFSMKVMFCSCTEGTPEERDRAERKKKVELGRIKTALALSLEQLPPPWLVKDST